MGFVCGIPVELFLRLGCYFARSLSRAVWTLCPHALSRRFVPDYAITGVNGVMSKLQRRWRHMHQRQYNCCKSIMIPFYIAVTNLHLWVICTIVALNEDNATFYLLTFPHIRKPRLYLFYKLITQCVTDSQTWFELFSCLISRLVVWQRKKEAVFYFIYFRFFLADAKISTGDMWNSFCVQKQKSFHADNAQTTQRSSPLVYYVRQTASHTLRRSSHPQSPK